VRDLLIAVLTPELEDADDVADRILRTFDTVGLAVVSAQGVES